MRIISTCFAGVLLMTAAQAEPVIATWYVIPAGFRLPDGKVYPRRGDFVAAHLTLPLKTCLLVSNPENGKHLVVTVDDRGPHIRGRDLDLSKKAAARLGIIREGVAKLDMQIEPCTKSHLS